MGTRTTREQHTTRALCLACGLVIGLWILVWSASAVQSFDTQQSSEYDPGDQHGFHPPLARLIDLTQVHRDSAYVITGLPGAAAPGCPLICRLPDGSQSVVDTADADGSFRCVIPFAQDSTRVGLHLFAADPLGQVSAPVRVRTDHPVMAGLWLGPDDFPEAYRRGWANLTSASVGEKTDQQAWAALVEFRRARGEQLRQLAKQYGKTIPDLYKLSELGALELPESVREEGPPMPVDALSQQTAPQDWKVYGFASAGEVVTCLLPDARASLAASVRKDGTFSIVLPRECIAAAVAASETGEFSYAVKVTDRQNQLLATFGSSMPPPRWAPRTRFERRMQQDTQGVQPPRGFLGIAHRMVDTTAARVLHLDGTRGIWVTNVAEDSPAERAGLRRRDVILKVDGQEVRVQGCSLSQIATRQPGDRVTLTIVRGGKERRLDVVLGEFPCPKR